MIRSFLIQWKVVSIILIQKPNKPPKEVTIYRPISILLVLTKVFGKVFLHHQFGFSNHHFTTKQIDCVVDQIKKKAKNYFFAVFINISQSVHKVGMKGTI